MSQPRPLLRVVDHAQEPIPLVHFCGHCGTPPRTSQASRVCGHCGMGVVLTAPETLAPTSKKAFVIIDSSLSVCAVSRVAEKVLDIAEVEAVNRHISDFLLPADAEARGPESLLGSVIAAAGGATDPQEVVVRPAGEFGVRFHVTVGPCGPPPAALLVFSDDVG